MFLSVPWHLSNLDTVTLEFNNLLASEMTTARLQHLDLINITVVETRRKGPALPPCNRL